MTGALVTLPGPMGGRACCGADMTNFSGDERQCDRQLTVIVKVYISILD